MKTFEKEIEFITWEYSDEAKTTIEKSVVKTATFAELNRTDARQHKLHFKIISLFQSQNANDPASVELDSDALYDITCKSVDVLLTINEAFTEADKKDFLNDSIALLQFGIWLFKEKMTPFFGSLKVS
jgi:hypothetical protein